MLFCVSLLPPTVSMLLCSAGSSPEPLSSGSAQRSVWSQEGRASVTLATLSLRSRGALRSRQMASSEVDGGPNKVSDLKKWTKRNFPGGPVAKTQSYQCRGHRFHPWIRKTHWRRKWQPTPVFLFEKFRGQRSLAGYSPWSCKVRHN